MVWGGGGGGGGGEGEGEGGGGHAIMSHNPGPIRRTS